MEKLRAVLPTIVLLGLLSGCATTHQDVEANGIVATVASRQVPGKVATCISRNSDDYFFASMQSKVMFVGVEPFEVGLRNGESQYANIKVYTAGQGSKADFYFSSLGKANFFETVVERLMQGCT